HALSYMLAGIETASRYGASKPRDSVPLRSHRHCEDHQPAHAHSAQRPNQHAALEPALQLVDNQLDVVSLANLPCSHDTAIPGPQSPATLSLVSHLPLPKLSVSTTNLGVNAWIASFEAACFRIGVPTADLPAAILLHVDSDLLSWLLTCPIPTHIPHERHWHDYLRPRLIQYLDQSLHSHAPSTSRATQHWRAMRQNGADLRSYAMDWEIATSGWVGDEWDRVRAFVSSLDDEYSQAICDLEFGCIDDVVAHLARPSSEPIREALVAVMCSDEDEDEGEPMALDSFPPTVPPTLSQSPKLSSSTSAQSSPSGLGSKWKCVNSAIVLTDTRSSAVISPIVWPGPPTRSFTQAQNASPAPAQPRQQHNLSAEGNSGLRATLSASAGQNESIDSAATLSRQGRPVNTANTSPSSSQWHVQVLTSASLSRHKGPGVWSPMSIPAGVDSANTFDMTAADRFGTIYAQLTTLFQRNASNVVWVLCPTSAQHGLAHLMGALTVSKGHTYAGCSSMTMAEFAAYYGLDDANVAVGSMYLYLQSDTSRKSYRGCPANAPSTARQLALFVKLCPDPSGGGQSTATRFISDFATIGLLVVDRDEAIETVFSRISRLAGHGKDIEYELRWEASVKEGGDSIDMARKLDPRSTWSEQGAIFGGVVLAVEKLRGSTPTLF
ncbi:hypothetical protein BCR44DRAFT_1441396, partial [Catenaria anguillulae PL171]